MTQVLASRNPHYATLADAIPIFSPKLNEAAANFEKLTAFVKIIRLKVCKRKKEEDTVSAYPRTKDTSKRLSWRISTAL
jgi:hypothetical protein